MQKDTQKNKAREFADHWKGKGYEKGQTQKFWIWLLRVLGVEKAETFIEFEDHAHIDSAHGFIDGYIPATHVLVEQKSLGKSLRAGIPQSDGSILNPFQQAKRYAIDLPYSRRPRWVVTCNFAEFLIYDMEKPNAEPESLLLEELPEQLYRLRFLVDTGSETIRREEEISKRAGDVVGLIYDALLKQYRDPTNPASLKSLNELCVRLVFLLYAEDAEVFSHLQFHDYLKGFSTRDARRALIDLFKVLDTPPEKRDPYLEAELAAFPYVNGGLFANENLEIPQFTKEIIDLILRNGSEDFDWKDISPTIFGAVFESTLNPETRRSGGMHYTSVANIHKVIDPLFLDALKEELSAIKEEPIAKTRDTRLRAFIDKLSSLTFLDPACGSGNFLTETYISLRRLENEALSLLIGNQQIIDFEGTMIRVSLAQFHGIEINDFACRVAQTALWIAENQMLRETETIAHRNLDFLPLRAYDGIVEGNALRVDWASLAPDFSYIIGNPPFIGHQYRSREQAADMDAVYADWKDTNYGKLDFVCAWYKKAADYMTMHQATRTALVSTNSITQGESVAAMWEPLFSRANIQIDFAYRTFRWDSESNSKAHVHCVIVGFSRKAEGVETPKALFDGDRVAHVSHINAYLLPAPDVFIQNRASFKAHAFPKMSKGSQPTDGGNLILSQSERDALISNHPELEVCVRRYISGEDYINRKVRYCLWLKDISPNVYRSSKEIMCRLAAVAEMRRKSPTASVRRDADTPMLFTQIRQPETDYFVVPEVSSERRRYIPIGYLPSEVIASNQLYIIPETSLYLLGVLTSNVHMAWMRAVAGRLKSDYRYSPAVYHNFPFPEPTEEQRSRIEATAQGILDARAKYPDSTLADLYDELTMPPELRHAHQENDRAVMAAYGFPTTMTESECVAELFRRYQALLAR